MDNYVSATVPDVSKLITKETNKEINNLITKKGSTDKDIVIEKVSDTEINNLITNVGNSVADKIDKFEPTIEVIT